MRGVSLLDLGRHDDPRGSLLAFGPDSPVPFDVKNVYFILDCPPDAVRAEHAVSGHTALIALHPPVTIDLDNGTERGSLRLTRPDRALLINAGVWFRLREFDRQTALAVLASQVHADMRRFDKPVRALLDGIEP
jgi:hypothetical protein